MDDAWPRGRRRGPWGRTDPQRNGRLAQPASPARASASLPTEVEPRPRRSGVGDFTVLGGLVGGAVRPDAARQGRPSADMATGWGRLSGASTRVWVDRSMARRECSVTVDWTKRLALHVGRRSHFRLADSVSHPSLQFHTLPRDGGDLSDPPRGVRVAQPFREVHRQACPEGRPSGFEAGGSCRFRQEDIDASMRDGIRGAQTPKRQRSTGETRPRPKGKR